MIKNLFVRSADEHHISYREDEEHLDSVQKAYSYPSFHFLIIMAVSSVIGTLGLLADSAVVIVGAMLIAPLMKPIISFSYGVVQYNLELKLRSLITLAAGLIVTVGIAAFVEFLLGLTEPTNEIMTRIKPSLIDLGIAIAAGLAASLAATRRNIAETLPGVAIAVSLVPPLCVCGVGLSIGSVEIAVGSASLFLINLMAIILTSVIVFLLEGYGSIKKSWLTFLFILILSFIQIVPLSKALKELKADDLAQKVIEDYLHENYPINKTIHPNDLERLNTILFSDHVFVFLELKSNPDAITEGLVKDLHSNLIQAFEQEVNFKIQALNTTEFTEYSILMPDGSKPEYGIKDLIPRR